MSPRSARTISAVCFVAAAAFARTGQVRADPACEPILGSAITETGPVEDCVAAVEAYVSDNEVGCPYWCGAAGCHKSWNDDNDVSEPEDYELAYPGCREVPNDPFKWESGQIKCKCGELVIE